MVCPRPLQDRMAQVSLVKEAVFLGIVTFEVVPTSVGVEFVAEFPGDERYS